MNTETIRLTDRIPLDSDESTASLRIRFLRQENQNISTAHAEYAEFLSRLRPWRWWFTGTFASAAESSSETFEKLTRDKRTGRSVQPEAAIKAFHRHLRHCQCLEAEKHELAYRKPISSGGFKWVGPAARAWTKHERADYVLTLERNKHNTGVHIHALVSDHPDWPLSFDALRSWWDVQGFGHVQEIRANSTETDKHSGDVLPQALVKSRYMLKYSLKQHDCELALAPWLTDEPRGSAATGLTERSEGKRPQGAEALLFEGNVRESRKRQAV